MSLTIMFKTDVIDDRLLRNEGFGIGLLEREAGMAYQVCNVLIKAASKQAYANAHDVLAGLLDSQAFTLGHISSAVTHSDFNELEIIREEEAEHATSNHRSTIAD
tara:strand:- start:133 stop:447 length:315 start_codon:yes stop_codon:yes gene_type:complete